MTSTPGIALRLSYSEVLGMRNYFSVASDYFPNSEFIFDSVD